MNDTCSGGPIPSWPLQIKGMTTKTFEQELLYRSRIRCEVLVNIYVVTGTQTGQWSRVGSQRVSHSIWLTFCVLEHAYTYVLVDTRSLTVRYFDRFDSPNSKISLPEKNQIRRFGLAKKWILFKKGREGRTINKFYRQIMPETGLFCWPNKAEIGLVYSYRAAPSLALPGNIRAETLLKSIESFNN